MASKGTALVTGGADRIGAAIARDLAAKGFDVAIHYHRSHDKAQALAASINADGGAAICLGCDLEDAQAAALLVHQAQAALGPVTLLVNNASMFEDDSAADFDQAVLDRHMAIHVKAPAILARNMATALPQEREGLIVNMIDQRVLAPNPRFYTYTLSKAALWMATRTMAQTFGPRIRVNAIGPGPTLANERQSAADFKAQVDGLLLKRGPELSEFGATIAWLWSARSVTGQMITLDGGQHLAWETPDVAGITE